MRDVIRRAVRTWAADDAGDVDRLALALGSIVDRELAARSRARDAAAYHCGRQDEAAGAACPFCDPPVHAAAAALAFSRSTGTVH